MICDDKVEINSTDWFKDDICLWKNKLPSKFNKKYAKYLVTMKINDEEMNEVIEEMYRRNKFDKYFDIGAVS